MLKLIVDSLDSVNENFRSLYVKNEESGKYHLQVEGAVPREKLDEFRNNNISLTNQLSEAKKTLESYKDIDPAKYQEYKTKAESFKGDQDIEEIVKTRIAEANKSHATIVGDLQSKLEQTTNDYHRSLISTEIKSAAMRAGARKDALDDIVRRAEGAFSVVNGKVTMLKDGQPVYGSDGVSLKSAFEWSKDLSKDAPFFFEENQGGGGGRGNTYGDVPRDKMTAAQMIEAGLQSRN